MRVIERIAKQMQCSYIYDDFWRINMHADKVKHWPLITEGVPADGGVDTRRMPMMTTTRNTMVSFLVPCRLDWEGERVTEKVDAMLVLMRKFLRELVAEGYAVPDAVQYATIINQYNSNLCGVRMTLPMTEEAMCDE